jgi:hypothetical protein
MSLSSDAKRRNSNMTNKRKEEVLEDYGDARKSTLTYGEKLAQIANAPQPIFTDDEISSEYDPSRR